MSFFEGNIIPVGWNQAALVYFFVDRNIDTTVIQYCPRSVCLSVKISRTAAVLTGVALVAFVTLVAFVAVNSCGFHSRIGRSNPPVAVFTDERGISVFAVRAVLSVCSVLTIGTVFAVNTIFTVNTVFAVYTVLTVCAVKTFQNWKIVKVKPYFIADITPL